jgi:PAS domain S-box-containing protein
VDLSGYLLEPLREDGEFVLYRARAKHLELPSVLLLSPVSSRPSVETLKKIDHEYSLEGELDATWAVRPLAISVCDDKKVLVLEDLGGEPLGQLIRGPMEIKPFLRLAIVLADAIGQLHKRDLIHKDLKLSNVLVSSDRDRVWLTGFGLASRLARERQPLEAPDFIAGTLAYMAPEQTGRMNRSIDSRSDLYALGVMLYELLTRSLPFTASDPMEWVHCHIARQPVPPCETVTNVPSSVSAIVMKLLAKTPEERYQTAYGARTDLKRCLNEWENGGTISQFRLGENDVPDRLLIPEKLYGRTSEIEMLLASFERIVSGGRPELVLVSGYSGIGKSSVVNELHKALVPPRDLFASGKFDQYKRDIPYATLAQAFQNLVRPLLTRSEGELSKWRDALHDALGPNGLLIVDLLPELKLIIGEQPPVPELPLQDAQHRFQLVFRRFIGVFARPEHPLALFFDDLQWLDAATLDLIEDLLTQSDVRHLMLIGAYRDNEVDSSHPLMRKLEAIRKAGATVQEIVLAPLTREDLARLIMDSFHCESERATPLADLIREKTAGNPFFSIQFISALTEEELVRFDYGQGRWVWDLNSIRAKGYTDNVVDLMVGKLDRLSSKTQTTLQLLACLGNSADFDVLELAVQDPKEEIHGRLWEAVQAGLIFRTDHSYKFLHDRVQEAAYSLIQEESRAEAHLRIGRLLFARTPPEKREDRIFEIVNQFNRGASLITSPGECEQVAELNLIAGKRAQASTAYTSALRFFMAGASLLLDNSWEQLHELMFPLELNRAQCEFLTGQLAAAEERLIVLSSRVANTVERATVTCLRADLYTTLNQSDRAVVACLEYLRHVDIEWTAHPTQEEARRQYDRIWSQLGNRPIEQVIEFPIMNDPASLATLDVLTKVLPAALFTDANLLSLAICTAVNLSLELGNSDASCVAYVWLGQIAGPHFGSYEAGFRFGQLGYELVERRGLKRFEARTLMVFGNHVMPWTKHVRAGRNLLRRAFETSNKIGDLTFAAYSSINLNTNLLIAGDPLAEVQQEAVNGLQYAQKIRFGFAVDHIRSQLGLICTLRGLTPKFGSFNVDQFDELRFESHLASDPALAQSECHYWIRKLQARFLAGDHASALDASLRAKRLLWSAPSNLERAEYEFYSALARAASWDSAPSDQRQKHFDALSAHSRQLEIWAEHCPENFENRAALVRAEIARVEDRPLDAEQVYEKAIRSAHANGFPHNEAVANEVAARFYAARGLEKITHGYLRDARYWYAQWGADGKVRQLEELYPHLRHEDRNPSPTGTIGTPVDHLDLTTFIKVSQAVSGEIVLEKLIDTLLRTAVEHAGAERGLLILPRGADLLVQAEATTAGGSIHIDLTRRQVSGVEVPEQVLRYAARTLEAVILGDASNRSSFSDDEYIRRRHSRSILCLPLVKQRKLIALLYLENNLAAGVFTARRIALLNVLASAAAISLENGRLYRDLEEREARIRRLVDSNIVGIFIWEFEGQILEGNDAFLRIVGYNREDLASGSMHWTTLTPREWHNRDDHALADLRAVGTTQAYEKEFLRKDGSRVPVLIGGALFEGAGNEGVAFALDLSEQKRAEEAFKRSESYLAQAQRVAHIGSWAFDVLQRKPLYFSEEWYRLFGFDPKDGMPTWEQRLLRVHPDDLPLFQAALDRAMREKSELDVEFRILPPRSAARYIRSVGHPVLGPSGEVTQLVGVTMDVTESKLAEEERERLRRTQAELAHMNRVSTLGELTASLAHEIKQPIGAAVTNAEVCVRLLDRSQPDIAEAREAALEMAKDVRRAADIIDRVRSLFQKSSSELEVVDVNEVIEEMVVMLQNEANRHSVTIHTDLAGGLPHAMADRVQLQQVLMNLMLNGIEAMQDASGELSVKSQLADDGQLLISVADTGVGLPAENVNKIFDAFFTTKSQGTGLGLPITRSIVKSYGGRIWATENSGRGATFHFTLPGTVAVPA